MVEEEDSREEDSRVNPQPDIWSPEASVWRSLVALRN